MKIITNDNIGQSEAGQSLTQEQIALLSAFNKLNSKMRELVIGVAQDLAVNERNRVSYPSLRLIVG